ncbi:hypothetical protein GH741_18530 [Aquibacillus halophilus]|uniref:Uncharacterized protein n=1 Tax=Aquibacillus halophilus TaxID=930132 RepID=A0A6A8DJJ1_9BACI|nr:hypothetical protein [Aquibacillus halophilus]MRH44646.1 hypothetical protein [Aquibacillus halophilus]
MKKLFLVTFTGFLMLSGCGLENEEAQNEQNEEQQNEEEQQNDEEQDNENNQDNSSEQGTNEEENDNQSNEDSTNNNSDENQNNENSDDQSDEQTSDSFDKGRAEVVLTEYKEAFNKVINNRNDDLKLNEFSTKQELTEHFNQFMSQELSRTMVDRYFREEDDGLYLTPMDAPVFLQEDQQFTFNKTGDGSATVVQERQNQLIGHVNMEYSLTKKDDSWIVEDVERTEI